MVIANRRTLTDGSGDTGAIGTGPFGKSVSAGLVLVFHNENPPLLKSIVLQTEARYAPGK
jgi:hypothetical protein